MKTSLPVNNGTMCIYVEICDECYAVVREEDAERHANWHERLTYPWRPKE